MTLFEALTGGAFDLLNWQHSGEFDQNFSKKSNARGFTPGGGGMGGFGIDRYITSEPQDILLALKKRLIAKRPPLTPTRQTCKAICFSFLQSYN